jgi:hypothetical protein
MLSLGKIFHLSGHFRSERTTMGATGGLLGLAMAGVLAGLFVTSETGVSAAAQLNASVAGALNSVSCVSSASCVAVGDRSPTSSSGSTSLAETWNGTKWSVVASPNPSGADGTTLYGVACPAAKNCLAVGDYFVSSSRATLVAAEKWNGTKWSLVSAPSPSGFTTTALQAITCTSSTNCWAAGSSSNTSTSKYATLTERWNGSKWSIVPSPSPDNTKPDVLSGVTCGSATECWAVGYYFPGSLTGSLTEKWNGSKWAVVTTPSSSSGELIGDACSGSSSCLAVGISNSLFALAQHWNGTAWTATTPVSPSGASTSELNAAACTGTSACETVGVYNKSGTNPTLGESWNGSKWTLQTMPTITGSVYASLQGLACPSATDCWTTGVSDTSSGGSTPVLEQWNGKTWSLS